MISTRNLELVVYKYQVEYQTLNYNHILLEKFLWQLLACINFLQIEPLKSTSIKNGLGEALLKNQKYYLLKHFDN